MKNLLKLSFLLSLAVLFCFANVQAQVQWSEYAGNPVMDFGTSGSWDEGQAFLPFVIKDGDTLKMWYGGGAVSQIFAAQEIGYAWSLDGINWTRYGSNPVLPKRPGEWDAEGTTDPVVLQDGDTLRLWYTELPATFTGPNGGAIGYATSVDGINWNRLSAPVLQRGLAGEWDADLIGPTAVIKEGNTFKMWYSGGVGEFPGSARISVGYATSTDGIQWTKYDDPTTTSPPFQFSDPVLPRGGAGSFDEDRAWGARILTTASGYEMWYAGEDAATALQDIGYATSTDGIDWTKYAGNPVLQGTWTNDIITGNVILDGSQYRMWFSGFQTDFPFAGRIGYATAPQVPVPVELTSFTATANNKEVILSWSTATELNNQGFEVQRKFSFNNFVTIGSVIGHGTTTSPNQYTYVDKLLASGKYFYRLKQIDFGGKNEYSQTVEINWSPFTTYKLEQNYPNPFNPITTIGFGIIEKGNVRMSILNTLGEEIRVLLNEEKEAGYHSVDFNASNLPSGVYFYQLKTGNYTSIKKLILLK